MIIRHDNGTYHNDMPSNGVLYIEECCTYNTSSIEWFETKKEALEEMRKEVKRNNPELLIGREHDTLFDLTVDGCESSVAYVISVKNYTS